MFDTVKLLLPRARAWTTTVDRMFVRFLKGLALPFDDVRTYADRMWRDNFPQDTRFLLSWEKQFALPPGTLTDQERRDRLDGVWASTGGQSPSYITTTLQARGFPVFTHPWFDVQPWGVPLAKDPREYLLPEFGGTDVDGFLLANQTYETTANRTLRGTRLEHRIPRGARSRARLFRRLRFDCRAGVLLRADRQQTLPRARSTRPTPIICISGARLSPTPSTFPRLGARSSSGLSCKFVRGTFGRCFA